MVVEESRVSAWMRDRFSVAFVIVAPEGIEERSNCMRMSFATSPVGQVYRLRVVEVELLTASRLRYVSAVGESVMVVPGEVVLVTVTVALWVAVPPLPVQESV